MSGMTPERLEEIRSRLNAATPGPWSCWNGYPLADPVGKKYDMHGISRIGPEYSGEDGQLGLHGGWTEDNDLFATTADAEFVATAPTAIADLLAEVDRLRAQVDAIRVRADYAQRIGAVMLPAHVLAALASGEATP